jgi:hypothetical protein
MKILSSLVDVRVGGIELRRGARYVAGDSVAGHLHMAAQGCVRIVADATVYTRPWRGEDLAGKRLLIYRPLGIGDEFLAARLAWIAKHNHNAHQVGLAIYENHHPFWTHTPDLPFRLFGAVIPWADWQAADYHVVGEHWWESISTADQPGVYDIFSSVCNIQIPESDRIPYIPAVPPEVLAKTAQTMNPWLADRPLVLWQLAATSRIRSYPPDQTDHAMADILARTTANIVAIGHPSQVETYEIQQSDRLTVYSGGIPGLLALIAFAASRNQAPGTTHQAPGTTHQAPGTTHQAPGTTHQAPDTSCLVCPDSVAGHIAATHPALPVISLWSSFHPSRRVASYPNHRPIFNEIKCSPCWSHEHSGDPAHYQGCPLTACNDYCAGLRAIPPKQISDAVASLLSSVPSMPSAVQPSALESPGTPTP